MTGAGADIKSENECIRVITRSLYMDNQLVRSHVQFVQINTWSKNKCVCNHLKKHSKSVILICILKNYKKEINFKTLSSETQPLSTNGKSIMKNIVMSWKVYSCNISYISKKIFCYFLLA